MTKLKLRPGRSRVPFVEFSTDTQIIGNRAQYWQLANHETILPIVPRVYEPENFYGRIQSWQIADISISMIDAAPCRYERNRSSIAQDRESYALVSFAVGSSYSIRQSKIDFSFGAGSFIVQHTESPYTFDQLDAGRMWVLKVPQAQLVRRIGKLERFLSHQFDASRGLGAMLLHSVREMPNAAENLSRSLHGGLARHLVELLALCLEGDDRVLSSNSGTVQGGHLTRVEQYIRHNIGRSDLAPACIAEHCGISIRYLHALFRPSGFTVCQWIREQRLLGAQRDLENPLCRRGIAEIAFAWGFFDHAQFCRAFKERFNETPTDYRLARQAKEDIAAARQLTS